MTSYLVVYYLLGIAVLLAVTPDDRHDALLEWAKSNPLGGSAGTVIFWPLVAIAVIYYRRR